jgi:N-acetylmuramoyl-L-alanine amidase
MKPLFISAGHSEVDPGAMAFGRREADIAVEFRNMVAFYLQRESVPFGMDGTGTTNLPLREAASMARRYDIAAEFHCNAASSENATGVEVLSAPEQKELAQRLSAAIANALGIVNRGAKPESAGQHRKLAFVQSGGVIVELFFITCARDLRRYDERKWVAAKAVADTLIEYARAQ